MYGKNALKEALLSAPKTVKKAHLDPELNDSELVKLLRANNIPTAPLSKEALRSAGEEASHQGVIAVVDTEELVQPYGEFIASLNTTDNTALVVLGEVQDPHNVGAIIRSAAAFGLAGVLIPAHNQAPVTGTVIKTSAGMAFRVPLVSIGNVNDTLRDLKERGFWVYGLAMEGSIPLDAEGFEKPSVFVLGNEGAGLREKTLETCDIALSIPMHPRCESLNVAVSAGVVFSAWSRKHPGALNA
ncbi:MAG TPA: 23S rRNA (guanosine(2251)-2'-O)-methyltransferase RlmB [Candidatus Paceibacterota bacterium]|nr:23S rRNA (guanosine(2251)-2'-O)-methyltransferase RlmB [Candidatus Paceibacterota bacterium]